MEPSRNLRQATCWRIDQEVARMAKHSNDLGRWISIQKTLVQHLDPPGHGPTAPNAAAPEVADTDTEHGVESPEFALLVSQNAT